MWFELGPDGIQEHYAMPDQPRKSRRPDPARHFVTPEQQADELLRQVNDRQQKLDRAMEAVRPILRNLADSNN